MTMGSNKSQEWRATWHNLSGTNDHNKPKHEMQQQEKERRREKERGKEALNSREVWESESKSDSESESVYEGGQKQS